MRDPRAAVVATLIAGFYLTLSTLDRTPSLGPVTTACWLALLVLGAPWSVPLFMGIHGLDEENEEELIDRRTDLVLVDEDKAGDDDRVGGVGGAASEQFTQARGHLLAALESWVAPR